MKPKLNKVVSKIKKTPEADKPHAVITQSNIEEHREKALESGRKFKYPVQISRHVILVNALVVAVVALIAFVGISWWMLYKVQDTGDFYYTATRLVPIPVASVDGEAVPYGDYMRRVRASTYYLEKQDNRDLNTEDGQRELNHTRRYNLDESEKVALANKIAGEKGLSVTGQEIDDSVQQTLKTGSSAAISEKAYENSLRRYFGWSMDDYRHIIRDRLMLRKAMFAVDDTARTQADSVKNQLAGGADFATLASQNSDDEATKINGGDAGVIAIDNNDPDGLIAAAGGLNIGQISDVIQGLDAYYIIKLTEKTDKAVRYSLVRFGLNEFNKQFEQLRTDGKIAEYIEIVAE
jgi:parvulin-like peptidyl-prolyl isomerase